jgi:hypothetical protein
VADGLSDLTPGLYYQLPAFQRRIADRLFQSYEVRRPTYGPSPHPRDRFRWAANSYKRSNVSTQGTCSLMGMPGACLAGVSRGNPAFWVPGGLILCLFGWGIVALWRQGTAIGHYFGHGHLIDPISASAVPRDPGPVS